MSILDLSKVDRSRAAEVGGKGANLGELARIPGIRVHGTDGYVELL